MKTCLIFMIVGWVALLAGYAASEQSPSGSPAKTSSVHAREAEKSAPASNRKRQTDKKSSTEPPVRRRAVEKNHAYSHASPTKVNRRKQPSSNGLHSAVGNAADVRQSHSNTSGAGTKEILTHNQTVNRTPPVRPSGVVRTNAPWVNNVRHRGPNPAVLGGPASSGTRNTAAINGAHLGRRP